MYHKKIFYLSLALLLTSVRSHYVNVIDGVPILELFSTKIEPRLFNWTFQAIEQFRYSPSLEGYPDLPSWMRYMYSNEYHAGFLYGTPTENLANKEIRLTIIALNKENYETRQLTLILNIIPHFPAANLVQMKIDNLNWFHMMDPGRVENLKNIFRKELWPESKTDLHLTFLESAVKMGARLPLKPQQREGIFIHLGSNFPFSARMKELQEEIRPLYKLTSCRFKRTSVQKIFENVGFKLDWCAFRIVGNDISPEILHHNHGAKSPHGSEFNSLKRKNRWTGIDKSEIPTRNYIDELTFSIAIPAMIFSILVGLLTVILCFQHKELHDESSEWFFQNIFHICEDYYSEYNKSTVQMIQCTGTNNQPTTVLKSLKDPNTLDDNISIHSQSSSPLSGNNYLRPKPPPYKAPSVGRNCVDI